MAQRAKTKEELLEIYAGVGELIEGRRWAKSKETGRMFHLLANDKLAYEQTFDWVGDYSEGCANVWDKNVPFLIDFKGNKVS